MEQGAAREMLSVVPAGYEVDETAHVGLTSDEAVADAIRRVFAKFDELGSARQVFVWWQREGLPFPVRPPGAGARPVVWTPVRYRAILATLHHPIYAGAYVFGRTETRRNVALTPSGRRTGRAFAWGGPARRSVILPHPLEVRCPEKS